MKMTSTNQVRSYAVEHHLKLKGHCIFPFSEELNKQLAVLLPKFPTTDATGIIDEGGFREKIPFGGKHAGKLTAKTEMQFIKQQIKIQDQA